MLACFFTSLLFTLQTFDQNKLYGRLINIKTTSKLYYFFSFYYKKNKCEYNNIVSKKTAYISACTDKLKILIILGPSIKIIFVKTVTVKTN